MQFYVYRTNTPTATGFTDEARAEHCHIWRDLKTVNGAVRRATRFFNGVPFKVFTFTEICDNNTFRLVYKGTGF